MVISNNIDFRTNLAFTLSAYLYWLFVSQNTIKEKM